MRTVKEPDVRKQEILKGALKVFAIKGYDKTTITDIARELGISQGLCYRYYASKEEIYDAALEEYANYILTSNLKRFNDDNRSFKEKILSYAGNLKEYRKPETDNEELYELFHGQNSQKFHDQLMMNIAGKLVPYIAEELKKAKESGEITISDPDTYAYFFVYGQIGLLLNTPHDPNSVKKIQDMLIELLNL